MRVVTSPDNCQGSRATEEIAPPQPPLLPSSGEAASAGAGNTAANTTGGTGGGGGGGSGGSNGGSGGGGGGAFFQLCAGEAGIEAGSEVTISYGPWPNDPFFLYFGRALHHTRSSTYSRRAPLP